eukprot:TRINITY_DN9922_c0_g1_i1.p1 TRINITY_DN9922_c0_g1~~TRINITY_DN9922_c0_g1_i1.p1  ORF type:complete len:293 (-),score=64.23 TRINITY_DN9922_c0_g1_i1:210-1064(-)
MASDSFGDFDVDVFTPQRVKVLRAPDEIYSLRVLDAKWFMKDDTCDDPSEPMPALRHAEDGLERDPAARCKWRIDFLFSSARYQECLEQLKLLPASSLLARERLETSARCHFHLGDLETAEQECRELLSTTIHTFTHYQLLASILMQKKDFAGAREVWQRIVQSGASVGGNDEALAHLACTYEADKDINAAILCLQAALNVTVRRDGGMFAEKYQRRQLAIRTKLAALTERLACNGEAAAAEATTLRELSAHEIQWRSKYLSGAPAGPASAEDDADGEFDARHL